MPDLKPCPFCGGQPRKLGWNRKAPAVMCGPCGYWMTQITLDELVTKWNRRASIDPSAYHNSEGRCPSVQIGADDEPHTV